MLGFLNPLDCQYERFTIIIVDLLFATSCVAITIGDSARKVADFTLIVSSAIFTLFSLARIAFQFRRFRELLASNVRRDDDPPTTEMGPVAPVAIRAEEDHLEDVLLPPNTSNSAAPEPKKPMVRSQTEVKPKKKTNMHDDTLFDLF